MFGARDPYRYPNGRPFPLNLVDISAGLSIVLAFVLCSSWIRAVTIILIFVAYAIARNKLDEHYLTIGRAEKIRLSREVVRFPGGLPKPMLFARAAFFVPAGIMFVFGFAPMPDLAARRGIIACIFALFALAAVNIALEGYYLKAGYAVTIDLSQSEVPKEDSTS